VSTQTCRICKEEKSKKSFGRWFDKQRQKYYIKTICNTCQSRRYRAYPKSKEVRRNITLRCKNKYHLL